MLSKNSSPTLKNVTSIFFSSLPSNVLQIALSSTRCFQWLLWQVMTDVFSLFLFHYKTHLSQCFLFRCSLSFCRSISSRFSIFLSLFIPFSLSRPLSLFLCMSFPLSIYFSLPSSSISQPLDTMSESNSLSCVLFSFLVLFILLFSPFSQKKKKLLGLQASSISLNQMEP